MHIFAALNTITFESLDVGRLLSHILCLQGIRVKLVYEGHLVDVMVKGAKKVENSYSCNVQIPSAITPVL